MERIRTTRINLYVGVAALAAAMTLLLVAVGDNHVNHWSTIAGFAVLAFMTAQFPLALPAGSTYDISFVIVFAATVAVGPLAAAIANPFAFLTWRERRRPLVKHAFNISQLILSAALPSVVYVALGGPVGQAWKGHPAGSPVSGLIPQALLALAASSALHFLINTTLVAGAISISQRRRLWQTWRGYPSLAHNYVAFALLGLLLGILQVRIGWISVLFLIIPLLVARQAFQAAVNMQRAFDDTARALIKAIETKDVYTRGHAERVSRLAEMTARAYGLSPDHARQIGYAALMHDVGKLGVDSRVLQKPGKLTADEYEHMKMHPVRGVEIVGEIDLLTTVLDGVRHHHERMDGAGYPDGVSGEEIPLAARLIMVADAFDSMTSTRTYRLAKTLEEAFAELRRCAGSQFDPRCLTALEKAVAQNGWVPTPELVPSTPEEVADGDEAASY